MPFVMLWVTLGLCLLMHFGIDDIVTYIALDAGAGDQPSGPLYYGLCLTLIVLAWPMVLLEYLQKRS